MRFTDGYGIVEAMKWNGSRRSLSKICGLVGCSVSEWAGPTLSMYGDEWPIRPGDYVVIDMGGTVEVVDPEAFSGIYSKL